MTNNQNGPPGRRQERHQNIENRQPTIYGDHIKQKRSGMLRILFQNPQGLGRISSEQREPSLKLNKLKDLLLKQHIDLLGLSEVNKDWRLVPQKETLWAATEGWFEYRRLSTSINRRVHPQTQTQYGGTALMAINKFAYSIIAIEEDTRKLGRWNSFLLRGKNQKLCRIICAYCPCRSTGTSSTYALQVVGLATESITECPRRQFWLDLKDYILKCQENKEQIIIMGDWNSNYSEVVAWMNNFDLHDIIHSRHKATAPPPTCKRSSSYPLDAIFAPAQVKCWRGGYLSYGILDSDHRGIWCDIPIEFILGYNMQHPTHSNARRLKTQDPKTRKRYLTSLHKSLRNNHVYEQFEDLVTSQHAGLLPTDILKFEALDNIITDSMHLAEKQCRKLKTGNIKWSPLYQKACDRVTYWTILQKEASGQQVNNRKLISLRRKMGYQRQSYTLGEITTHLREAIRNRQKCKKYAPELQMDYRYRLAKALEEENNIPASIHIRNLTHQENTRALYRRIRYMERKIQNLSTSRVTTSTKRGRKVELVKKEEVEKCILLENERKYHQTEGTGQLQIGRLLRDFGTMGNGEKVESLLSGTYSIPSGLSRPTRDFLHLMKRPPTVKTVPPITFQEFRQGWAKAKERTSSNGPHFGHYKAAMSHSGIAFLLYQRALFSMVTGYSPRRHRQGIDVMLLKKENDNDVERLRTIVLFDSEANMNYKHLGRRSMDAAISNNLIATEQYSRPNRKSIDHALNRRLVIDHQLYQRQPYAITSCDLKSCYDRINHTSASLALQRIGMAKAEVLSMFTTIQYMTHRVRTAYGDSLFTYGGLDSATQWSLPPQGVLQGNGSGPAIWSILSSCIFQLLRQNGHCNSVKSSIRKLLLELSGFAYVDDTDLLQVDNTVEEVVSHMQRKLTEWNDIVGVTGGILSPSKCWWYLITFKYIAGRWKAVSPQGDFNLWLKDERNKKIKINSIEPTKGTNMLGVYLAPDGNTKDHVAALRAKAERWATNIQLSRANQDEVWTALHRTIPFSLCYSLPAVTLTKEACRYIMAPITKCGLPLAGIASTIPYVMKVGPIGMGGLGIIDPYLHMGISQIETFISNTWQKTPTGMLLEVAMDDLVLELGLPLPWIPTQLQVGLSYAVTNSWIRHMVQFCLDHEIQIAFDVKGMMSPKRMYDRTIMDLATENFDQASVLSSINKIRMALNVVWISDIGSADGLSIDKKWLFPRQHYMHRNDYRWPCLHHVNSQDWRRWRDWARTICINQNYSLRVPLGRWTCTQREWLLMWDSYTTLDEELLYIRSPSGIGWMRHVCMQGRRRRINRYFIDFLLCSDIPEEPDLLKRVSYKTYRTYIELTSSSLAPAQWNSEYSTNSFWGPIELTKDNLLRKIHDTISPTFLESTEDINLLIRDYAQGTILAVSDGSYYPDSHQAAAAWIIESQCGTQWLMGSLFVPGAREEYSSYRSELTGLLAISIVLRILAGSSSQPPHVIVGCDGKAALASLTLRREDINANSPHADISSMIVDLWSAVDTKPYPVHIMGHQNDTHINLTRFEKLNVLMDKLATMTAMIQPQTTTRLLIPSLGFRPVEYNSNSIGGALFKTLYNGITEENLMQYYADKLLDNSANRNMVNFDSFRHARTNVPTGLLKFISKWLSNTLATGKVLQKRRHRIFNRCPRCNNWGEDRLHVAVCWDIRAAIIRKNYLSTLRQLLLSTSTKPEIIEFIIEGLTKFFRQPQTPQSNNSNVIWQQEQWSIGWLNFLSGFIGKEMVLIQQAHYKALGRRNKGKQWASKLIVHNWHLLYKLWLGRNEVLHHKEMIHSLSGATLLDIEVEREYDAGYMDLPLTVHKWFQMSKTQLLGKSVEYKKGWLLIVRTVRESLNIAEYSIFSSSRALRKWVGLNR